MIKRPSAAGLKEILKTHVETDGEERYESDPILTNGPLSDQRGLVNDTESSPFYSFNLLYIFNSQQTKQ